ncbi:ROK family protein [Microlunatus flavus]|uniref:Glucokinase n=1 Tax=Microlunatus flavus TaxID=1036181 RepID=A0A1H9HHC3_9ACTN|nr:ROK family protein [Microlunatus flavus]SEQ61698.1 glucokinase [Microlunatus flavus]
MSPAPDSTGDVLLGVDVGGTKVDLALARLDGTVLERRRLRTNAADGAEQVVARACALASGLVGAYGRRVAAVGAVSPGVPQRDRVLLAPNIDGWGDLHVEAALRSGLAGAVDAGTPLVVGNDVKAGALAEARSGALRGSSTGLYLNLGTGVAMAVVVGGTVLAGAHGAAGEVAYVKTAPGQAGAVDDRAPLEEQVGGRALDTLASRVAGRPTTAVEALQSDDERVRTALAPALDALDVALVNACCLLDPDVVVVAGGLMGAADVLLPRLRRVVERGAPLPPRVLAAHHTFDAPLVGALLLAADAAQPRGSGSTPLLPTKELA